MLEIRIKKYMDDIVNVAFKDEEDALRNKYKRYYLKILVKEKATSSGCYYPDKSLIEIYNPSLGARHLAKCCLHELSHHIDKCKNGETGHQKPFYEVYRKLIYASLDMGILTAVDFDDHFSSDQNKVRKMVSEYIPHPIEYKLPEEAIIKVKNAFAYKDILKDSGFRWNKIEQTWEKDYSEEDEAFLKSFGVLSDKETEDLRTAYYLIKDNNMYIDAVVYIEASGNAYECREVLKEYHFYFNKELKKWVYKVDAAEKDKMLLILKTDDRLRTCNFGILKRKK